jgi:hypothetical protein
MDIRSVFIDTHNLIITLKVFRSLDLPSTYLPGVSAKNDLTLSSIVQPRRRTPLTYDRLQHCGA